jgi:hypothetical protein
MRRNPGASQSTGAQNLLLAAGLGTAVVLFLGAAATAADEPPAAPSPRCEIAVVNPVSNFAECVKPRGAHVDPPPKRAMPSEEECRRHPDLDVDTCRQYAAPPATAPQS